MFTPSSAGERRDLGDHARAVGHRDRAAPPGPRRPAMPDGQVAARGPGPLEQLEQRRRGRPPATSARARVQRVEVRVERGEHRVAVGGAGCRARSPGWPAAMRVMSRNPPAARRSSVRCSSSCVGRDVHQRGRRELRHVAHDRDERVVMLGRRPRRPRRRARATSARTAVNASASVRGGRREHPGRADEQVGVGAVEPSCSEPAIGWPPTKRAAASGRAASTAATTGAFTEPTSVTTARAGVERVRPRRRRPGRPAPRRRRGRRRATASSSDRGDLADRAELLGPRERGRVAVEADDS